MHPSDRSVGTSCADSSALSRRLSHYGVAAVAAAATGIVAGDADAAQVTLPVNITAVNSIEMFIDILPFASGANAIAVNVASNSFSAANPLAPGSELMLRGAGPIAQLRGNNGTGIACFSSFGYSYVLGVGAPFVVPPFNAGSFINPPGQLNPSLTYPYFGGGMFPPGTTDVAYFIFNNPGTGLHHGWATIQMQGTATNLAPTITALHVETTPIPEPSSMALLCLGAAGLAAYRRKNSKPN